MDNLNLIIRQYLSSVGSEFFISFEDKLGYLYGFTRLLLPLDDNTVDIPGLGPQTAILRELHVYGTQEKIGEKGDNQHSGLGKRLLNIAEKKAKESGYERLSVISGVGVREYYRKLGYQLVGTYMMKEL
ncbi:hypothetical protein AGMMS50249_5830 [candidate division SR1 bacterium]|nr:hypothetical protein AGMMS50249_5830 [candidate division SR1 bacterium]